MDGAGVDQLRISLGTPGDHVRDVTGEPQPTGGAWEPEPKTWPLVVEGIADWADATLKAKLNELVGAYNQLRTDYNDGTVPTSAQEVDPLP